MSNTKIFSAHLDFSNNKEYQLVYASQLYCTFFMVYAKIDASLTGNDYTLNSIDLHLINYKGILDLGIRQAVFEWIQDNDNPDIYHAKIKIEVQAMYSSSPEDCKVKGINTDHTLKPRNSYLLVDRRLKPMHPENQNGKVMLVNGVFDSEFFYREGDVEDGRLATKPIDSEPATWEDTIDDFTVDKGIGRPRCPRSQLKII